MNKPFLVEGIAAHQKPKGNAPYKKVVWAKDAVHAAKVYRRKLRGVKKKRLLSVVPVVK